jgi:outer membrane lipoprotein SlyB
MKVPARFIQRLGFLISVGLLLAATGGAAMGQATLGDEGRVEAIEIYRAPGDKPVNAGTLIGGVAGGVIGHQIGSGRGNTAATIAGAIGGAIVGNEIGKKREQVTRYRITVRLDSGSSLIVEDTHDANLRVGDRVRVEDNRIYRQ